MKEFNLNHQYQLYLERVGLKENKMIPAQKQETKRAFMGACGQLLILLRDDITMLDEDIAEKTLQDMLNQVSNYWLNEKSRTN